MDENIVDLNKGDSVMAPSKTCLRPGFLPETEFKTAALKHSLNSWREVLLPINSILNWEKQWHPFSILGCTTIFFMMVWLLEPSVLTTISLLCLTLTLSDYFVPHLASTLLKSEQWTDKEEEKLENICRSIIMTKEKISLTIRSYSLMRTTRPKLYYGITIVSLLFLAWIGNTVNNLILTYLISTFVLLMPGMERQGILQKYGSLISDRIAEMATSAKLNVDLKKSN